MKSETYPLAMPADLLGEMRNAAKRTSLSMADTMRQSMKLGLPKLLEQLSSDQVSPLTEEECRLAYHNAQRGVRCVGASLCFVLEPS